MLPGESGTPPGGNSPRAGLGRKRGEAKAGAGKAKASRLRLGYVWQGYWDWKQARDLAEGDGGAAPDRQALRHQSSSLLWLWGEGVKQCWAFSLPLPR